MVTFAIAALETGSSYGIVFGTNSIADFNFAAVGDWGCNTNTQNTLNNIISKNPELVLGLGDYSYHDTADCWLDIIKPIRDKMKIVIGNQEIRSASILNQYMKEFNLTKQFYSFNYQNMHFLAMSTQAPFSLDSEQYNFVKDDLSKAAADPNLRWIIVYFHMPMYTFPDLALVTLVDIYQPLFDHAGVDLVLSGHRHHYERSYPIALNSNSLSQPIIASNNSSHINAFLDPEGHIDAVVGTAGIEAAGLRPKAPYIAAQFRGFGFLNVDILNNGTELRAKLYDNGGSIRDQFTIIKANPKGTNMSSLYHYEPYFTLYGSSYKDLPSSTSLKLTTFTIASWFKTSKDYSPSSAYIVNKGGSNSDIAGNNMNYGIWIVGKGQLEAGFETQTGEDFFAASSSRYNDGKWHYAVATYDGSSRLALYVDGVLVASRSTSGALPDSSGSQPLRTGANSLSLSGFFIGELDEIRVWNRALSSQEVASAYHNGLFNTIGQVVYDPYNN
jgi:predicted phosphodiesterase